MPTPPASSPRASGGAASSSAPSASSLSAAEDGTPLLQTSAAPSTSNDSATAQPASSYSWASRPASVFSLLWNGGRGRGGSQQQQQQPGGGSSSSPAPSPSSSSSVSPPDVESGGGQQPSSSLLKRSSSLLPRVPSSLGGILGLGGGSSGEGGGEASSSSSSSSSSPSNGGGGSPGQAQGPPPPYPCCLICLDPLTPEDFASGAAMRLECSCRGDLALRHRACAEKWSEVKGDRSCDVCRSVVENLPEPPPRPAPAAAEEGGQANHLEGVPPHLLPFVFGPGVHGGSGNGFDPVFASDGRVVSPFWAAVAAERGSGAGVAAHLLHPVPPLSSADAAFDFLRVAWIGTIISLLWLDMPLPESFVSGAIAAVIYTAVVRATAAAQVAALRRELAAAAEAAAVARGGGGGGGGGR